MRNNICDNLGKIIGYTQKIENEMHIFDQTGKLLGKYSFITDYVYDNLGRLVGRGTELIGILFKK